MPKRAYELSPVAIKKLPAPTGKKYPTIHTVGGVAGLLIQITPNNSRSWILRININSRRRDVGLGSCDDISLAEAREKARIIRNQVKLGIDPILAKNEQIKLQKAKAAANITFEKSSEQYIEAKSPEWTNPKHKLQWINTLKTYAHPVIGSMAVGEVELNHVLNILEPIWKTKTETASRLRGRLEVILDWAKINNYRSGENPARWKSHLDKILPSPKKIKPVKHFKELPVDEVKDFIINLRKRENASARALEFLIFTAVRPGEVRGAEWKEIDLEKKIWTIPGVRMKNKKTHRIPLSTPAINILKSLNRFKGTDLIFPSSRNGKLSDMTLTKIMRDMQVDAVPHGFRTTFKLWSSEYSDHSNEASEMALSHSIKNKVEEAYRRGDLFEKRRKLMADWALFCTLPPAYKNIISLNVARNV